MIRVFLAALLLATPAAALPLPERIMLQAKLTRHGFPTGREDGQIDAATRVALYAFARVHGIAPDADSVWEYMTRAAIEHRAAIGPGALADAVRTALGEVADRPSALRVRDLATLVDATEPIVCGQVSESGGPWRPFLGWASGDLFFLVRVDGAESAPVARLICASAFPIRDPD